MDFESYKNGIKSALSSLNEDSIVKVSEILLLTREKKSRIFLAGNGGSASTASHLATDLMFSSKLVNPGLKVMNLTDNSAMLTATGNDLGYENTFSRQLTNLGDSGDVMILISASGNSPNLLQCVDFCKAKGIHIIGFTGFDGGALLKLVDTAIHIPTPIGSYGIVEDMHMMVGHIITEKLKLKAELEIRSA
jgi:D-sedoheptulose 7-phosphate isomerase